MTTRTSDGPVSRHTTTPAAPAPTPVAELPLYRLHLMRVGYAVMGVGLAVVTTTRKILTLKDKGPDHPSRPAGGRRGHIGGIVAGSLATGLFAALLLVAPFIPAKESDLTGAVLCGFALGWAMVAGLLGHSPDRSTHQYEGQHRRPGLESNPSRCPPHHSHCLDWVLIWSRRHLEQVVTVYVEHYNAARPHRGIQPGRPHCQ